MGLIIEISVDRDALFEECFKLGSFEGKVVDANGNPIYDIAVLSNQDRPLFDGYFDDARKLLVSEFNELVRNGTGDGKIRMEMQAAFNVDLSDAVISDAVSFMVKYAMSKWFANRVKAVSETFAIESKAHADDMRNMIYSKTTPTVKTDWP